MSIRPIQVWSVDGIIFNHIEEAERYIKDNRKEIEKSILCRTIRDAIKKCPFEGATPENDEDIANVILAYFNLTLKD